MNNLRPSALALMISAALTAGTVNASSHQHHQHAAPSLSNFDQSNTSPLKGAAFIHSAKQKELAEQATRSGNPSQYDARMGKATFLWAPAKQAKPDLNLIEPRYHNSYSASYYLNSLTGFSTEEQSLNKAKLSYVHDIGKGPLVAKYRQEIGGISVFNKEYNIVMDRNHNLVAGSGYLANKVSAKQLLTLMSRFGSAEDAVLKAVADISSGGSEVTLTKTSKKDGYVHFDVETISGRPVVGNPRAKQVFFDANGELISAWYVEVILGHANSTESDDFSYVIDASGKTLFRKNLVAHAAGTEYNYRVFAHEDGYPMQGPHGDVIPKLTPGNDTTAIVDAPLISLSHYSKISTADPWLPEDANITFGNNVFSYADVLAPQDFSFGDITVPMSSPYTFDYPMNPNERDNSYANRQAAVVNLFYMNNFLHDWWYDHGFDEASGNAQQDNYGRGGVGGDPLHVQAQDFSGLNNANMATPADGGSPRMQQYLWTSKDATNGQDFGLNIKSHPGKIGMLDSTRQAFFGPPQFDVYRNMIRVWDGNMEDSGSGTDGCEPVSERVYERIAVIDDGSCSYTQKVKNAQDAGAWGAIIVNHIDDGTAPIVFQAQGDTTQIDIPVLSISYEDGQKLYEQMEQGKNVTGNMFNDFALKDSTFDNGIVAHEWGHYIQNRLVGNSSGLVNFQGRAMGEGWSDFHSLMFIVRKHHGDIEGNAEWQIPFASGTYVTDFFNGIRRAPYTTNMDINPLTFQHITDGAEPPGLRPTNGGSPHAAGEMWGTVLWEVYVRLLNMYEFEVAQARMANYLVASYKATPIAPTYTEARDALLSVMLANDADDYQAALEAFAKRGMGFGAISPDRASGTLEGVTESYGTQQASFSANRLNISQEGIPVCTADGIIDAKESAVVSFNVKNNGSDVLNNVTAKVEVLGDADVTLENGGMVTIDKLELFEQVTVPVNMTLNSAGIADTLQLQVSFPEAEEGDSLIEAAPLSVATTVNYDFVPQQLEGLQATDNMETIATIRNFRENDLLGNAAGTQSFNTEFTTFFESLNPGIELGERTMYLRNNGFQSDVAVETGPIQVGFAGDFSVNFWHFYLLEAGYDGAVVEVSINNSAWLDVTQAGGQFAVGYNAEALIENETQAIQGRPAFTGTNGDLTTTAGNMETINFGQTLNGQTVRFRFRIASDFIVNEFGWVIDNVTFNNINAPVYFNAVAGDAVACD